MRNLLSLTKSVLKGNIGFTIGLILMFAFSICLIEAMCVIPKSMDDSFEYFYNDFNMHESYIYYDGFKEDEGRSIEQVKVDGVRAVDEQKYISCKITDDQDNVFSAILFSNSEAKNDDSRSQMRLQSIEHADNNTDNPSVKVSRYFALNNNIHAGDYIYLSDKGRLLSEQEKQNVALALQQQQLLANSETTIDANTNPQELEEKFHKLFISDIIVCPETMHTFKDAYSWCESGFTPYLYMEPNDIDSIFNSMDLYNVCYLYFNDNVEQDSKNQIMDKFCEAANITCEDKLTLEDSSRYKSFEKISNAISKTLTYIPFLILFLTFICTFLFIRQVITREAKLYTLLSNLGYKTRQARRIFSLYTTIFLIMALIVGSIAALIVISFFVEIIKDSYNMPYFLTSINLGYFVFLLLLLIVVCYASTIINFYSVAKQVDRENTGSETKFDKQHAQDQIKQNAFRLKNVFIQNCIIQMKREWVRTLATCGCLACSFLLTFCGIALLYSYYASGEYTYKEYFKYDSIIFFDNTETDSKTFENDLKNIKNVDQTEYMCITYTEAGTQDDMQEILIRGIVDNAKLICPIDAEKNQLYPNDGVVVEEYFATSRGLKIGDTITINNAEFTIEGLARECVNQTLYVSVEGMKRICDNYAEAYFITLCDNAREDQDTAKNTYLDISKINGYEHKQIIANQHVENDDFSASVTLVNYLLLFEALLVGLIVVLNTVHLNIYMRKREYATLLALGTKMRHFFQSTAIEYLLMYILSCVVGVTIGYIAADKLLFLMSSSSNIYYFVHQVDSVWITLAITFTYVIIGIVYTLRRIRNLDFTQILNDRE